MGLKSEASKRDCQSHSQKQHAELGRSLHGISQLVIAAPRRCPNHQSFFDHVIPPQDGTWDTRESFGQMAFDMNVAPLKIEVMGTFYSP